MNVSVVLPQELGPSELAAWRTMQRSSAELDNAFLSPAFTLAAGRVRSNTRVAVLEEGQDVVGFFPFEQARFPRVGRPLADGVSDAQAVIHAPGLEWNAKELLRGCHLDVFEFDHLIASQIASAQNVIRRNSSIIDVSQGYQAYITERQRATKIFKSTFAKQRKLERDFGELRFEFDIRDPEALRVLMRWKSAQYQRTGRRDNFAIGWIERLAWDLFETRSEGCAGMLSVLYSTDRAIAAHFGLQSGSTLSWWFPAYDVSLARYSPGLSLLLKMAEGAAAAGLRSLDLGKGDEDYKASLMSRGEVVGEGRIERPTAAMLARTIYRPLRRFAFDFSLRHPTLRRGARRILKPGKKLAEPRVKG